eukprot:472150-Pleurochrysis_carterae.AAC.1
MEGKWQLQVCSASRVSGRTGRTLVVLTGSSGSAPVTIVGVASNTQARDPARGRDAIRIH